MGSARKKVGLALGSGSARGISHLGVIQALEENDIPIDAIAGTSIGAFVAAIYATDKIESYREFVLKLNWRMILSYFDVVFPKSGLLEGKKVHDLFSMHTKAQTFDDFRIPVKMVATDLTTGQAVIMDSGNIIEAIRASISVPGVFTPVVADGRVLVDGGLVNPIPVDVARSMSVDIVIAVNLNDGLTAKRKGKQSAKVELELPDDEDDDDEKNEILAKLTHSYSQAGKLVKEKLNLWLDRDEEARPNIMEVLGSTLDIMEEKIARTNLELHPPDVLITPRLGDLSMFDFDESARAIQEGYDRAMEKMDEIRKLVKT